MKSVDITVIDYGIGNILSVQRGLEHCGAKVTITSDHDFILASSRVVLPGVGAFKNGISELRKAGLDLILKKLVKKNVRILGICLGMQMLLDESEEFGLTKGLGLIPGKVISIPSNDLQNIPQKIPHIGWGKLVMAEGCTNWNNSIMADIRENIDSAYFVHSYMAVPNAIEHRIADCYYGGLRIPAVIGKGNIVGCQFHPEKSGVVGLKILKRFCSD